MKPFKYTIIAQDKIQISGDMGLHDHVDKVMAAFPTNKERAVKLVTYAIYMTDLTEDNPYRGETDLEHRSKLIQGDFFGQEVRGIHKPVVQELKEHCEEIWKSDPKCQRVTNLRLSVNIIHTFTENLDTTKISVTDMKEFAMMQISGDKVATLLDEAEKDLTDSLRELTTSSVKKGQSVTNIF